MPTRGLEDGRVSGNVDYASGAWLLTRPLELGGTELYVNAAASAGSLRVEILDEQMRPLAPFGLTRAEPIRTDAVRIRCRWQDSDNSRLWRAARYASNSTCSRPPFMHSGVNRDLFRPVPASPRPHGP